MVHDAGVHADGQRPAADARAVVGRPGRRRVRVHTTPSLFGGLQRRCRRRSHAKSQSVINIGPGLLVFFSFLLTPFDIFQKDLSPTVIVFLFRKQNTKTSIPLSRKLSTEPFLDLEMIIYHLLLLLLLLLFEKLLVSAK